MNVSAVLKLVATLSWLLFFGMIAIVVVRASRNRSTKAPVTLVIISLVAAVLLSVVSAGLVFVRPEDRGVVVSAVSPKGYREQALDPGLRWIVPFFENVVLYRISKQTYTMSIAPSEGQVQGDDSITARTKDGQEVYVDASVIYAIDPTKVVTLHITWQDRYSDDLIRPLSRGVIRDVISQYNVEEVVSTRRLDMITQITDGVSQKLTDNGLILSDFILRNITFSPDYAQSVEQKQIAEQEAKQAFYVVEQRKQEAEQARQVAQGQADAVVINAKGDAEARIIQAEAEAKALLLIAEAIRKNPDLLTYQYIQKLAPGIEVMLVPNDTPYLLPLPTLTPK